MIRAWTCSTRVPSRRTQSRRRLKPRSATVVAAPCGDPLPQFGDDRDGRAGMRLPHSKDAQHRIEQDPARTRRRARIRGEGLRAIEPADQSVAIPEEAGRRRDCGEAALGLVGRIGADAEEARLRPVEQVGAGRPDHGECVGDAIIAAGIGEKQDDMPARRHVERIEAERRRAALAEPGCRVASEQGRIGRHKVRSSLGL